MRWASLVLLAIIIAGIAPALSSGAGGAKAVLEGDEFWVSVDPSDPDQGMLEVEGALQPNVVDLRDKLTVTLSSNITEMGPEGRTGRYWHSTATFDGAAGSPTKVFRKGDPAASFTIELDPTMVDPQITADIPVPTGISLFTWGRLVLTATYSGASEGASKDDADIFPEPFYLVNLTMNTNARNVSAGGILNFSFNIKNPSNQEEGLSLEMPSMGDLAYMGWNVSTNWPGDVYLSPGEDRSVTVRMVAPDEIPYDDLVRFGVSVSTIETDPDTGDPWSSASGSFDMNLMESRVDDGDGHDGLPPDDDPSRPSTEEILAGVGVISLVVFSLMVMALILLRFRGRRKGPSSVDRDHSVPVRM